MTKLQRAVLAAMLCFCCLLLSGCSIVEAFFAELTAPQTASGAPSAAASGERTARRSAAQGQVTPPKEFAYADVPEFSGEPYTPVNNNVPFFSKSDMKDVPPEASRGVDKGGSSVTSFETYSDLDALGRCGPAFSAVGKDIMPTEKRGSISEVRPSGWVQAQYDFVDGESLYNRCHLLGYQLTAENANPYNLITGTRYMNTQGMLPFENMVADYVKETGDHVLYRVTPVFVGDELVARGVLMEARSMEDDGDGVEYCVFAYNVQPGVEIDYATGVSRLEGSGNEEETAKTYVLNVGTKRFHTPDCDSVGQISKSRREEFTGTRQELIAFGYTPCGSCRP